MDLSIIHYPHPTLRYASKPVRRVDRQLKELAAQMVELMYEHRGVGLAANQVNVPLRMFVVNPTGERGEGEELVLINPVIQRPKGSEAAEEGCLSLPGVYGQVVRPKQVRLTAYDLSGNPIDRTVDGFLSRVLQHEYDHLQGTLFFDRMSESAQRELGGSLEELELAFRSKQREGGIRPDEELIAGLQELEQRYA